MSGFLKLFWENVQLYLGQENGSPITFKIILGTLAIILTAYNLLYRQRRQAIQSSSATRVEKSSITQKKAAKTPNPPPGCPYKSKQASKNGNKAAELDKKKTAFENIKKMNGHSGAKSESLDKILQSESFVSSFKNYAPPNDQTRTFHPVQVDQAEPSSTDAPPSGCIFMQIMQEIEEKRRLERLKEGKCGESDLFETDEKSQLLNSIDDGDDSDGEDLVDILATQKIEPISEEPKQADQETEKPTLPADPEPEQTSEEEIDCQKKQLERIFQLLKEQEMISQLESYYTERDSENDDENNLKTIQSNDDFKFSILKDGYQQETEYELKNVFESQMKLYGIH